VSSNERSGYFFELFERKLTLEQMSLGGGNKMMRDLRTWLDEVNKIEQLMN
jgi:hypothetical protein